MINEIPNVNDGAFDYNPLNIAARQTEYFMKNIPARERLTLLNKINTKTLNHERYDYSRQIAALDNECFIAKQEEKLELKENKPIRDKIQRVIDQTRELNEHSFDILKEKFTYIDVDGFQMPVKIEDKKEIEEKISEQKIA